jgi:ketosteroid isomerase-like protein
MSEMLRILERGYELIWHEDRIEHALRGLGEDFEWIVPEHPEGAVRHGPDGAIGFFRDWREQFQDLEVRWKLEDIGGGRGLALTWNTGRGRVSGAPVEMHFAQVWTFRDGRFVRMVMADTPQLAIARDAVRFQGGSIDVDIEEMTERDNRVLLMMRWPTSGPEAELCPAAVFEFEGRRISRTRFFLDREWAREAFESG